MTPIQTIERLETLLERANEKSPPGGLRKWQERTRLAEEQIINNCAENRSIARTALEASTIVSDGGGEK